MYIYVCIYIYIYIYIVTFGPSRHRAHPGGRSEGSWRILGAVLVSRGVSLEPLGGSPGPSCRLFGTSWEPFGGLLGLLSGLLGASWGVLWASWGYVGRLGCHLGGKGSKCRFVFPLWGPSWRRLGALSGRLGGLLGRLGALLGRLRALLGASWVVWGRSGSLVGRRGQWEARKGDHAKIYETLTQNH